ncbi:MAG: thiamine phosphate synthase [Hyphomicrobiales bacterium]|jgi:thiamine-phosphate pyrophosphorylase|nr:thiamine phosphate synthase [Hyphomicrobiales bacterium]
MATTADLRLYFVTDPVLCARAGLVETVLAAVQGGATLIQLRNPVAKAGALVNEARALVAVLAPLQVPLIINDRPDVARAVGAAGVHVGQDDLPPAAARAILGPDAIIGLSITQPSEMAHVPWDTVDHLGVGPVVSRGVKPDAAEPMGLAGLAACVRQSRRPLVAIGGMDLGAAHDCIMAGADGIAVVAGIAGKPDPRAAAAALRAEIDEALRLRGDTGG